MIAVASGIERRLIVQALRRYYFPSYKGAKFNFIYHLGICVIKALVCACSVRVRWVKVKEVSNSHRCSEQPAADLRGIL